MMRDFDQALYITAFDAALLDVRPYPSRRFCAEFYATHPHPSPIVTVPQAFDLATMSYCVDWWTARSFETDSESSDATQWPRLIAADIFCHQRTCSMSHLDFFFFSVIHQSKCTSFSLCCCALAFVRKTLGHSRLSSLSHYGPTLASRMELVCVR